jgi:hypothetical protein
VYKALSSITAPHIQKNKRDRPVIPALSWLRQEGSKTLSQKKKKKKTKKVGLEEWFKWLLSLPRKSVQYDKVVK